MVLSSLNGMVLTATSWLVRIVSQPAHLSGCLIPRKLDHAKAPFSE